MSNVDMLINIFSTIALVLSLTGQFLLAKRVKIIFPIWIASNFLWIAVNFIGTINIQEVIMYIVYTAMNINSWRTWVKEDKKLKHIETINEQKIA